MPTVNVKKDLLMKKLGTNYTDEQFDELCFEFGIELDEITSEKTMTLKEKGQAGQESDDVIYKIDVPANRYDLLCLEGLVLALKIFSGKMLPPEFHVKPSNVEFVVDAHAEAVRPVLVGAIVRAINFDSDLYNSFIDLQDKIHQNIGRKRSIVSIGTHDLDKINGPFLYTAMKPNELKFVPLNQDKEMSASQLMEFYSDTYLKPYLPLIKDKPEYPVILDANKTVLSMPPIINGDKSKITLETKNILIEVTATDREKATIALDTIVTMLMSSKPKFEAESVKVTHSTSKLVYSTPNLSYNCERIDPDYVNKSLGIAIEADKMAKLLTRMSLKANVIDDAKQIEVHIPPTRHDIIHKCDVMEDVGIAYGYDNIRQTLPKCSTIATQVQLNKLSDQLRHEVARCGFTEALNFALCSEAEISEMLRRPKSANVVKLQNPKTSEFQVARTCLLSGLLKTLLSNKKMALPMKVFEVSDVLHTEPSSDVGVVNERRLAAVYCGKQSSGFEVVHGLMDRIMQVMGVTYIGNEPNRKQIARGYYIEPSSEDGAYLEGRCAAIVLDGNVIGNMGILHPEVLFNFELNHPCSAIEFNIEKFAFVLSASRD